MTDKKDASDTSFGESNTMLLEYPKRRRFIDRERNVDVTGPTEMEVSNGAVETYLNQGWEKVAATQQAAEGHWKKVVNAVEEGEFDGSLDKLAESESERDAGARKTVMEAIENREAELSDDDDSEGSDNDSE